MSMEVAMVAGSAGAGVAPTLMSVQLHDPELIGRVVQLLLRENQVLERLIVCLEVRSPSQHPWMPTFTFVAVIRF